MVTMVKFRYGGYWDVPRDIVFRYRDQLFLFLSSFDEDLDEYPDDYSVYRVPTSYPSSEIESWMYVPTESFTYLGQIPIRSVTFDATLRKELDASVLDPLIDYSLQGR